MNPDPRIAAVTFDVGGTLLAVSPSVGQIYSEVAVAHGCARIPAAVLNRRFAAAWRTRAGFRYRRAEWAALVDAIFDGLTPEPPSQTFFPALYQRFAQPGAWRVFPDVLPTLRTLKSRGLKLGVISNWDDRLRPLLQGMGLASFFQAIVISCEVGAPKPAQKIFHAAVAQLEVPAHAVLHVGDSQAMDVIGAQAAGLRALLIDRRARAGGPGRIRTLRDLCNPARPKRRRGSWTVGMAGLAEGQGTTTFAPLSARSDPADDRWRPAAS